MSTQVPLSGLEKTEKTGVRACLVVNLNHNDSV